MVRSIQTLDNTQAQFRQSPSLGTARAYVQTALEYTYDYMISSEEFVAIGLEVQHWLKAR